MESNFEEQSFFSLDDLFIDEDKLIKIKEKEDNKYLEKKNKIVKEKNKKKNEELKKEKNRISAKKYRNKKNFQIQMIINENKRLRNENIELKEKINEIKDKLNLLCEKCQIKFETIFSSNKKDIFFVYKEPQLKNFNFYHFYKYVY